MNTNEVLTQANDRAESCAKGTQAWQDEQVRLVREEIGHGHYEAAKAALPAMEQAIARIYQPFVNGVAAIAQRAGGPVPPVLRDWLQEINTLCEAGPRQLREGVQAWEGLTFQAFVWTDGASIDVNRRPEVIVGIRQALTRHDGILRRLRDLKARVESWVTENEWPRGSRPPATTIPADPPAAPETVPVVTEFQP